MSSVWMLPRVLYPAGDRYSANVSISHNVHKLLYPSSDPHQSGISFSLVSVHCWWLAILVRILQCVRCCQLHSSCSREASHRWRRPVSSVCCSVYCSDLIKTSLLLNRWYSVPVEAASLMNFVPEEVVQVSRSLFLWTLFLKKLPLFHELKKFRRSCSYQWTVFLIVSRQWTQCWKQTWVV